MKDYFSGHSSVYATFRPTYPKSLYEFVFSKVTNFDTAWDCATGSGQVARELATKFKTVQATDISQQQLNNAFTADNIRYTLSAAEETSFADDTFDLITVGQALHWFNTDGFFDEVQRVSKPGGVAAIWGYSILSVNEPIDKLFLHFYHQTVGGYWDAARKHVETEYDHIAFPAGTVSARFSLDVLWTAEHFLGYLRSWSATQKFINTNRYDPTVEFGNQLFLMWAKQEVRKVTMPVFLKLIKIN